MSRIIRVSIVLQYQFAPVFNAQTFLAFLKRRVRRMRRKIFLVIDNSPCHNLDADGKAWLAAHRRRLELFRLPSYSSSRACAFCTMT